MDKTILQRWSWLYDFFGSVKSTRGKTASQGNLYQLRADSMVERADMPVCQGQVPLRLLLRLCVSGAHPCFPPVVPFILAPFSLLLSVAPGKQTRRRLHIRGRWVNPVGQPSGSLLSSDAQNISGPRHHSCFWVSPQHLQSTNKYELAPGVSLH